MNSMTCAVRGLVCIGVAGLLAACGERESPSTPRTSSDSTGVRSIPAHVTCSNSWTPNARTFANEMWREQSVRVGPVTLLNAHRLARVPVEQYGTIKIRTLIKPETSVTMRIDASSPPGARVGIGTTDAADDHALRYDPCPAVPRRERAIADVADVGFPLFVSTSGRVCLRVTVEAAGDRTVKVISLGAGRCSGA
jgi:hypothetical protein